MPPLMVGLVVDEQAPVEERVRVETVRVEPPLPSLGLSAPTFSRKRAGRFRCAESGQQLDAVGDGKSPGCDFWPMRDPGQGEVVDGLRRNCSFFRLVRVRSISPNVAQPWNRRTLSRRSHSEILVAASWRCRLQFFEQGRQDQQGETGHQQVDGIGCQLV